MNEGGRQTGKPGMYAGEIKDVNFGIFQVLNTANAWFGDLGKVQRLIDAYKIDANDLEACAYAGISPEQLRYFNELHPDFSRVKSACYQVLGLAAKNALAKKVQAGENVDWYLSRKRKEEYTERQEITDPNAMALDEHTKTLRELLDRVAEHEYGKQPEQPSSVPSSGDVAKSETPA